MTSMADIPANPVVSLRVCGPATYVNELLALLRELGFDLETSGTYPARHTTRDVRVYASITPRLLRPLRWLPTDSEGR
ncbi:hypothetical protein ACFYO1_39230 [Nocardia sp. NPDC006044]|uniref:hypothetical protein n=1 Tax=Nocardia sp. NPDC006044 TaxID=3364306 RepID=UPI0036844CFE